MIKQLLLATMLTTTATASFAWDTHYEQFYGTSFEELVNDAVEVHLSGTFYVEFDGVVYNNKSYDEAIKLFADLSIEATDFDDIIIWRWNDGGGKTYYWLDAVDSNGFQIYDRQGYAISGEGWGAKEALKDLTSNVYAAGFDDGYRNGYENGYTDGFRNGYDVGYTDGSLGLSHANPAN